MFEVVVGNIGKVWEGKSEAAATATYREYRHLSETGYGRCAGESVTLFWDNDILEEYTPANKEETE